MQVGGVVFVLIKNGHILQTPPPPKESRLQIAPVTSPATILFTMLSFVSGGSAPSWAEKLVWSFRSFVIATATPLYGRLVFVAAFSLVACAGLVLYCSNTSVQTAIYDFTATLKAMAVAPVSKANDPSGDFQGDIKVNNNPPSKADLEKVAKLPVLGVNKKSHTFKSLWADDENGPRRVLVVFIRHFFCGVCLPYSPVVVSVCMTIADTAFLCRTARNTSALSPPP